jgi:polyisoprenoid-binding protein YceI
MKLAAAVLAATLALASPVLAESSPAPTMAVEAGQYKLDKTHAKIIFSFNHLGFSTSYGLFSDFDASLSFDPKAPAKSALSVNVVMDGVLTTVPKFDAHLKSPDLFDTAKFPAATFKSTAIEVTGPTTGKITGDLTLRGITKTVVLDAALSGAGVHPMNKSQVAGFSATTKLKRSDFGLTYALPVVGDDVTLTIACEFVRQP